jgi:hypothetical protein
VINARLKPNECDIPMGIASLAAYLKDKVDVKCLDARVEGYNHIEDLGDGLIKFGLSEIPSDELRKIHRWAFWSINISFLHRDPVRFIQKYYRTLYYHPDWAVKFVRSLFQ